MNNPSPHGSIYTVETFLNTYKYWKLSKCCHRNLCFELGKVGEGTRESLVIPCKAAVILSQLHLWSTLVVNATTNLLRIFLVASHGQHGTCTHKIPYSGREKTFANW